MNTYEMRNKLNLQNYNTEITRKEFEEKFYPTKERIIFTFQGWDGKSYEVLSIVLRKFLQTS